MNNESEIERLRKEGYTEEQIKVELEKLSKIRLQEGSINPKQPNRQDKSVYITSSDGKAIDKRTSSLMLGKNLEKDGSIKVELSDGSYISELEVKTAIDNMLNSVEKDQVVLSKRTGKRVNNDEIEKMLAVTKKAGKLTLGGSSPNIINQDSRTWTVTGKGKVEPKKAGVMMLGNVKMQLPCGDYVNYEELKKALDDFIVMTPPKKVIPIIPVPRVEPKPAPINLQPVSKETPISPKPVAIVPQPIPNNQNDNVIIDNFKSNTIPSRKSEQVIVEPPKRKVKARKKRLKWLIIALLIATILSGIRVKPQTSTVDIPYTVVETLEQYGAQLKIEGYSDDEIAKIMQGIIDNQYSEYAIGSEFEAKEGLEYHESSDHEYGGANKKGTIGGKYRESGKYNITVLAILYKGKIVAVSYDNGTNLNSLIKETCLKLGVTPDDLELALHLSTLDGKATGWINARGHDNIDEKVNSAMNEYIKSTTYEAETDNIEKGTVTFKNADGVDVTISILDKNGELIQSGTTAIGSDGKEYKLTEVNKTDQSKESYRTEYKTVTVDHGNKITWKFTDMSPVLGAATLLSLGIKKKEKEETNTNEDNKVEEITDPTKRKIQEEAIYKAQERYYRNSGFARLKNKLTGKAPNWKKIRENLQKNTITIEDVNNMYKQKGVM